MLCLIASLSTALLAVQATHIVQQPLVTDLATAPTVTVGTGKVIGTVTSLPSATVSKFLGIPYASPPARFATAAPISGVHGTVTATAWGPACMQQFGYNPKITGPIHQARQRAFDMSVFGGPAVKESENCLYLNVYAPSQPSKTLLPVMFYIFGGGMKYGHAGQPLYDGSSLAANQGVVVVTINYRTNLFGFPNSPITNHLYPNIGFNDQRKALQWVNQNIAAFGGDPNLITLFGQSAGARSVDRLVLSPGGLKFRAAILQSGTATFGANINSTKGWDALVAGLGCGEGDFHAQFNCVQKYPVLSDIIKIIEENDLDFLQRADGYTKLATPVNRTALSQSSKIPMLIGSNGQESRVFDLGKNNLKAHISALPKFTDFPDLPTDIEEAYAVGSGPGLGDDYSAVAQLDTERNFQCDTALTSKEASEVHSTWRYYFNQTFPNDNPDAAITTLDCDGCEGTDLEAFHTSELAYVFGNLPIGSPQAQLDLSKQIQSAWGKFVRNPEGGPGWATVQNGVQVLNGQSLESSFISASNVDDGLDSRCGLWLSDYCAKDSCCYLAGGEDQSDLYGPCS